MKYLKWSLPLALVCCSLTAWGEELYVRNRLFKGYATGVSRRLENIQVDLVEICKLLELELVEKDGNAFLVPPGTIPDTQSVTGQGVTYYQGKPLAVTVEGEHRMVYLKPLAELMGGRLSHNPSLKTVDFNLMPSASRPAPGAAAGGGGYRLINFWGEG